MNTAYNIESIRDVEAYALRAKSLPFKFDGCPHDRETVCRSCRSRVRNSGHECHACEGTGNPQDRLSADGVCIDCCGTGDERMSGKQVLMLLITRGMAIASENASDREFQCLLREHRLMCRIEDAVGEPDDFVEEWPEDWDR